MSEWENNENENRETEGEIPPEGVSAEPSSEEPASAEGPASSAEEQPSAPTQNTASGTSGGGYGVPAFVWEGTPGKKPGRRRKGNRAGAFCAVAVVCLVLTAAICLPTIFYVLSNNGGTGTPGSTPSASLGPNADGSYDVSQTVQASSNVYTEESDLTELYNRCSPSCVTIYVTFGNRSSGYAIGSGFVLTEEGYIATNQHVVDGGEKFRVIFYDGTEYDAKLIGGDATRDLAVLKIEAKDLIPLEIGDSDALSVGQTVVAIGTPYDLELAGTLTRGIISGVNRDIDIYDETTGRVVKTMRMLQTDTSINPGNSGGPMINLAGQVVGINSMKLIDEYEGLGFAIPINYAVDIFNQLIQYGKVVQEPENSYVNVSAWLGVTVADVQAGLETYRITPRCEYPTEGALIVSLEPNTAVYAAGLQQFDIVTDFDGHKINSKDDLVNALAQYRAGDVVTITVFTFSRNFASGETRQLTFTLDSAI